jgi:Zn-dependent protease
MDVLPLVLDLGILTVAVVLHEVGHGVVAYACGDPTAAERGRLTLNPLRHVDPVGTFLLPGILLASAWAIGAHPLVFGWAKPVPVDFRRLRRPRRDMALVAAAGPAVNLVLAALAAYALRTGIETPGTAGALIRTVAGLAIGTNCVLAVMNLLPILPLDGGRILTALLPRRLALSYARLERVGLLLAIVLFTQTSLVTTLVRPVIRSFISVGTAGLHDVGTARPRERR